MGGDREGLTHDEEEGDGKLPLPLSFFELPVHGILTLHYQRLPYNNKRSLCEMFSFLKKHLNVIV